MKLRALVVLVMIVALQPVVCGQEKIKSAEVKAAQRIYERQLEELENEFRTRRAEIKKGHYDALIAIAQEVLAEKQDESQAEAILSLARKFKDTEYDDHITVWRYTKPVSNSCILIGKSGGRCISGVGQGTWSIEGDKLTIRWPSAQAPGGMWIDTCTLSPKSNKCRGKNNNGVEVVVELVHGKI